MYFVIILQYEGIFWMGHFKKGHCVLIGDIATKHWLNKYSLYYNSPGTFYCQQLKKKMVLSQQQIHRIRISKMIFPFTLSWLLKKGSRFPIKFKLIIWCESQEQIVSKQKPDANWLQLFGFISFNQIVLTV